MSPSPTEGGVRVAGLLVAGGRSRRFGRDKAGARLDGRPLAAWALATLDAAADPVAVAGPSSLAAAFGREAVADDADAAPGPLAGVLAGLAWAKARGATHLLTAPCDTPRLPPDLGVRLRDAIGAAPVAIARAERPHPLCALWRVDAAAALAPVARAPRQPRLADLVAALGGVEVAFPDEAAFANVNFEADLARLAAAPSASGQKRGKLAPG